MRGRNILVESSSPRQQDTGAKPSAVLGFQGARDTFSQALKVYYNTHDFFVPNWGIGLLLHASGAALKAYYTHRLGSKF